MLGPLSTALTLALLVVGWLALAPTQFGGQVSYVVVAGNSMEPALRTGDLTVVRRAAAYSVGDVVAYRHPDVGTIIHRIVDRSDETFVLKGDHNTWLDSYTPAPAEVVGKLWLHLPSVGTLLQGMRAPWVLAVLGGLIGVLTVGSGSAGKQLASARRRVRRSGESGRRTDGAWLSVGQRERGWLALALAGVAVCAGLAVLAHRAPLERTALRDVTYEHTGAFSYSAAAAPGSRAYDGAGATTGDPIFRKVASTVNVGFSYALLSERRADLGEVGGQYRVTAVVSDINGWKRTLELAPLVPFSGTSVTAEATLDLAQLQALLDVVHEQTGAAREVYQVAIVPELQLEGTLAGQAITPAGGRFAPALTFKLDPYQLQPVAPPGFEGDPLKPAQRGLVKAPRVEPNGLPLLSYSLPMAQARTLSLGGLGLSVLALGITALVAWRAAGRSEAERIAAQYGALIASVTDTRAVGTARGRTAQSVNGAEGERRFVDVVAFDDLVRIAEREGRTILQDAADGAYVLPVGELTYRYVVAGPDDADGPGQGGAILRLVPRSTRTAERDARAEWVGTAAPRFVSLRLERAG